MEVVAPDGTRCDILTDEYAIEVDFANKWAEAIGQALNYAIQFNKMPERPSGDSFDLCGTSRLSRQTDLSCRSAKSAERARYSASDSTIERTCKLVLAVTISVKSERLLAFLRFKASCVSTSALEYTLRLLRTGALFARSERFDAFVKLRTSAVSDSALL